MNYLETNMHQWQEALELHKADYQINSMIMACYLKADARNTRLLEASFPKVCKEAYERYHAPGGALDKDELNWLAVLRNPNQ